MRFLERYAFHTIFFTIAAVITVFSHNYSVLKFGYLVRPLTVAALSAAILLCTARLFISSWRKAGVLASVFILSLLFFSHLLRALGGELETLIKMGIEIAIFQVCIIIVCLTYRRVVSSSFSLDLATAVFNITAICFMALPILNIVWVHFSTSIPLGSGKLWTHTRPNTARFVGAETKTLPDIYYIILDGYGRSDILREYYDYDNGPFLDELRKRGFFVASKSRPNYATTYLSVGSSLNMEYFRDFTDANVNDGEHSVKGSTQLLRYATKSIDDNAVMNILKQAGYINISYESGYSATDAAAAHLHIRPKKYVNEFEITLLDLVPLGSLMKHMFPSKNSLILHKQRVLYVLKNIARPPVDKRPIFVFAHIVAPHPPFIFDKNGKTPPKWPTVESFFADSSHKHKMKPDYQQLYKTRYVEQLQFINNKILTAIDDILALSKTPPIIILQGDHGPGLNLDWRNPSAIGIKERMAILNAYLAPKQVAIALNDRITPVNTFRLIFSKILGMEIKTLPNKSYFSTYRTPNIFTELPNDS